MEILQSQGADDAQAIMLTGGAEHCESTRYNTYGDSRGKMGEDRHYSPYRIQHHGSYTNQNKTWGLNNVGVDKNIERDFGIIITGLAAESTGTCCHYKFQNGRSMLPSYAWQYVVAELRFRTGGVEDKIQGVIPRIRRQVWNPLKKLSPTCRRLGLSTIYTYI